MIKYTMWSLLKIGPLFAFKKTVIFTGYVWNQHADNVL